jgi:hypothetical protein
MNVDGWFDFAEFYDFVIAKYDNAVFVEVGVWKGKSIKYLAENAKDKNIQIWGIDSFKGSPKHEGESVIGYETDEDMVGGTLYETYLRNISGLNISTIKGDSGRSASYFDDNSLEFVFIDADHHYKEVKKDIIKWWPKIKKGGIISGHDYATGIGCGVIEAVDECFPDRNLMCSSVWWKEK